MEIFPKGKQTRLVGFSWLPLLLYLAACVRPTVPTPEEGEAGAALQFWTASRAYPAREIPPGGWAAAWEGLKRPLAATRTLTWEALGPQNFAGRSLSLAINPQNPGTLWLGTASGGLWKSHTAGQGAAAWHPVPTGFPVLGVGAVAVHPQDTNLIFIGTGEVYNYRGTGTGRIVWKTRGTYGIGILRSLDGGQTWELSLDWMDTAMRGVNQLYFHPQDSATLFAATTEGLFRSRDLGITWEALFEGYMVTDLFIHAEDPQKMILAAGNLLSPDRGIYRSSDGGGSWVRLPDFPDFGGKVMLGASPANPEEIYASVGDIRMDTTELWRSSDFGRTWEALGNERFTYGWFAHDVAVNPADLSQVLCAGQNVWEYQPPARGLRQLSGWWLWYDEAFAPGAPEGPPNYVHADIHDIQFDPHVNDRVYFVTDGGLFVSEDAGRNFSGRNGGLQTAQFYPGISGSSLRPNLLTGGLQDNKTAVYEGQPGWRKVLGGDGGFTHIHPRNDEHLLASFYWLSLFWSENGGNTFTPVTGIPALAEDKAAFIAPFMAAPAHPERVYAAGDTLYRSQDGGRHFERVGNHPIDGGREAIAMAISYQNSDRLYISTSPVSQGTDGEVLLNPPARILHSRDGGNTWEDISRDLPDRICMDLAVHPQRDATLFAALGGYGTPHLFKSEDSGATWRALDKDLPDVPFHALVVDPWFPEHLYAGCDLGVFLSQDGGESWAWMTEAFQEPVLVADLWISPADRRLVMATHGRGMYAADLSQGFFTSTQDDIDQPFVLLPNPTRQFLELRGPVEEITQVEWMDTGGRRLSPPARVGPARWDVHHLPAGYYVVVIHTAEAYQAIRWQRL